MKRKRYCKGFGAAVVSKRVMVILALLIMVCWGRSVSLAAEPSDQSKKRLAVIGFTKEITNPEWDNHLIGFGLAQLLLQKLFDTGRYLAIEDNPEIISEINRLIEHQWGRKAAFHQEQDAERIAGELQADAVAYGKIIKFDTKRTRAFAGPISKSTTNVIVELEVYLKERQAVLLKSTGAGMAATKSVGVFFQIRNDKLYFDQTAVGSATEKALIDAVDGLWK